jgi:hypothetical protein
MAAARDTSAARDDTALRTFIRDMRKKNDDWTGDDRLTALYDFVMSQQNGKQLLENVVDPDNFFRQFRDLKGNFKESTAASVSLLQGLFVSQLQIWAFHGGAIVEFTGHAGGMIVGIPLTRPHDGTLFYNDVAELQGECSFFFVTAGGTLQATFWMGGTPIAIFQAENNVLTHPDGISGNGKWTKR